MQQPTGRARQRRTGGSRAVRVGLGASWTAAASMALLGVVSGPAPARAQVGPGLASAETPQGTMPGPVQPPNAATNPFGGPGSQVVADDNITATEQQALQQAQQGVLDPTAAQQLLGKLVLYDRNLSPNRQQACVSCHTHEAGFTGGLSSINASLMSYSGALFYRWGQRKPQGYSYAPFAPVLHYDAAVGQFFGGNFWDERATGEITGNPSGDQAMQPLIDPLEMELPDPACVAYRIASGPYRAFFQRVWGFASLAINWPANAEALCSQPQSVEAANPTLPGFDENNPPTVLTLSAADRALATQAWHNTGLSAAAHEAGPDVSPFSSKFDRALKGQATLTAQEQQGYALFTGQGHCSQCHSASGSQPLFTNWGTANLGVPKNTGNVFYTETQPDQYGFVPNPSGAGYVDPGLGGYLASPSDIHPDWHALAPNFVGRFQIATLRNVAKVPFPGFVKDYMHNGYFKSLKDVVHFYNTRDVLPTCPTDMQDSVASLGNQQCWSAPEQPRNVNRTQIGNLGLSSSDEDAIVAFLDTLSDGYTP